MISNTEHKTSLSKRTRIGPSVPGLTTHWEAWTCGVSGGFNGETCNSPLLCLYKHVCTP